MEKRIGPRMEPWGTPQKMGAEEEDESLMETLKDLFDKYDENQFKAEPETPTHLCNLFMRME